MIITTLKDNLSEIVKSGNDFKYAFENLTLQNRILIFDALKDK